LIRAIAGNDNVKAYLASIGVIEAVLSAMQTNLKSPGVVEQVLHLFSLFRVITQYRHAQHLRLFALGAKVTAAPSSRLVHLRS
jgi:hypothetical protein